MLFDIKSRIPITSKYPFMNEPTSTMDFITTKPATTYDNLDFWIERTPEAVAIINAICTDIKSNGYWFEGDKGKIKKAEHFAKINFFAEEYFKFLWDWNKYGDAYMWIAGARIQFEIETKLDINLKDLDEDIPKAIRYIPATTMNLLHDGKNITKFRQQVNGQEDIEWKVKDVIHGALLPNKGKVYGFSPSWACLTEMNIIGYLKDYAGTFFKNGCVPDWMFSLPNEQAGSPNHKELINMLQKYKHPQRKHGNLVFTGDVKPTQIGTDLDKINISDNAIYFTSVLALAHNMPVSRVASLIGAKVKVSTGGDDLANEGYWNKIAEGVDRLETWFNTQLWEKYFDVKMHTNRAWITNEVKEQQRDQFAINNIMTINKEYSSRYGKQLTIDAINRMLHVKDEDLEKGKPIMEEGPGNMSGTPFQKDKLATERGAASEAHRAEKQKQIPQGQKLGLKSIELKSKITHVCNKDLFFRKFERWVKRSDTRDLYFSIKNNILSAVFSTPDENFSLNLPISDLDKSELSEIKSFGEQTEGIL